MNYARTLVTLALIGCQSWEIQQGIFYLFASQIKDYLSPQVISELNAVGGLLVLTIGINMTFNKGIKIANMLPAIFIPLLVSIFS